MHWSLFAYAGVALIAAHFLRLPAKSSRFDGILAFATGLFVAVIATKIVIAATGLDRTTDFDRFTNAAVLEAERTEAPLLIFSGASYSRNGLDPDRLSERLSEKGFDYRAINLSIEAASVIERDNHIQQFMALSGEIPDMVFIEVSEEFDNRAAFMFGNSKFNDRAIEQFDLRGSLWTLLGIRGGACYGTSGCLKDAGFLGAHTALNVLNVGAVGQGRLPGTVEGLSSFDPITEVRRDYDILNATKLNKAEAAYGPQWVRSYRAQMHAKLSSAGVRAVGYYQPPVLSPEQRAYAEGLCLGELSDAVCLHANSLALMGQINGEFWVDPSHLNAVGAAIYSDWLADQLIASGALEATQ